MGVQQELHASPLKRCSISVAELISPSALIVRADVAFEQQRPKPGETPGAAPAGPGDQTRPGKDPTSRAGKPAAGARQPHRFFGSVEIDLDRPVKSFDSIFNAVVLELQRTQGTK
ncbi:MAG TPA: hypothetical protein VMU56_04360 [Beijerinckiaceae bacterium]|nr:hypothetical protein [Beijerinckiaceae bacterium]